MNKFPYISVHDVDMEKANIIEFHVEQALSSEELGKVDVIERGLHRPMKEPPVNKETMGAVANLLNWDISDWSYSEISFSAVLAMYPDSGYPQYAVLRGGCDYTGWGCQSGSDIVFSYTLRDLAQYALSEEEREAFNYEL